MFVSFSFCWRNVGWFPKKHRWCCFSSRDFHCLARACYEVFHDLAPRKFHRIKTEVRYRVIVQGKSCGYYPEQRTIYSLASQVWGSHRETGSEKEQDLTKCWAVFNLFWRSDYVFITQFCRSKDMRGKARSLLQRLRNTNTFPCSVETKTYNRTHLWSLRLVFVSFPFTAMLVCPQTSHGSFTGRALFAMLLHASILCGCGLVVSSSMFLAKLRSS